MSSYMPGPPHAIDVQRSESIAPRVLRQPAILALAGRILFALIFILSSYTLFNGSAVSPAVEAGVPFASVMVPIAGAFALVGGLSILAGFYARVGAWLVVIFLVPVTLFLHNFWILTDPAARAAQEANFMKNVAMLGGALIIAYFGAGPMSWDRRHS